eukprot:179071-Pelagomonas_calceolata.AAC.1
MGSEPLGPQQHSSVPQREADLVPLRFRVANARTPLDQQEAQTASTCTRGDDRICIHDHRLSCACNQLLTGVWFAQAELNAVLKQRASADAAAEGLAHKLFMHPETSDILIQNHGWLVQEVFTSGKSLDWIGKDRYAAQSPRMRQWNGSGSD